MGERHGWLFELTFNRSIKVRQADPRITSDAGIGGGSGDTILISRVSHAS